MTDISIIIPVFNVASWLPRSVEAILANDTAGCELILVDDGSSDGSPALCDRYAAEHLQYHQLLVTSWLPFLYPLSQRLCRESCQVLTLPHRMVVPVQP